MPDEPHDIVIPEFLTRVERPCPNLAELEVTTSMHTRKTRMFELADAFVTLSGGLGTLVSGVHGSLRAEFPSDDLVYLNVQRAFDGARLCERTGSPGSALATPIRLMDGPSGTFLTDLGGRDKIAIQRIANSCVTYFQTCQESWHPNAAGHGVLGQCLSGAAVTAARSVQCVRSSSGAITVS